MSRTTENQLEEIVQTLQHAKDAYKQMVSDNVLFYTRNLSMRLRSALDEALHIQEMNFPEQYWEIRVYRYEKVKARTMKAALDKAREQWPDEYMVPA